MNEPDSSRGDVAPRALRWTWAQLLMLAVVLIVALVVRLNRIDASPSFDEVWHLRLSAAQALPFNTFKPDVFYAEPPRPTSVVGAPPIWRVWTGMDGVLHPPLYATTLRLWRDCFGDRTRVANGYSIAWGLVAIAFTFAAARLAMGGAAAFLVALAMTLSPTQVYFAQEIRAYAMLIGLASIAAWLMARVEALGPSRRRAIALAAMTLPLLLTHYFAFGAAAGIAAYGLWRLRGERRAFAVALGAAALVYAVVWLPFAIQQLDDLGTGDVSWAVAERKPGRILLLLANAPFRLIADRNYAKEPTSLITGLLFVLPWPLRRRLGALLPWTLLLTGSLGGLVVLDLIRSTEVIHVTRYLAVASPAAFLVFAGCGHAIDRRLGALVAAGVAAMGAIYLHARLDVELDVQSFGAVPAELARHAAPGEPLLAYGGEHETFYGDSIFDTTSSTEGVPRGPYVNLGGPVAPALRARLGRRAWLICIWHTPTPEQLVPGCRVLWRRVLDLDLFLYYLALDDADAATRPSSTPSAP